MHTELVVSVIEIFSLLLADAMALSLLELSFFRSAVLATYFSILLSNGLGVVQYAGAQGNPPVVSPTSAPVPAPTPAPVYVDPTCQDHEIKFQAYEGTYVHPTIFAADFPWKITVQDRFKLRCLTLKFKILNCKFNNFRWVVIFLVWATWGFAEDAMLKLLKAWNRSDPTSGRFNITSWKESVHPCDRSTKDSGWRGVRCSGVLVSHNDTNVTVCEMLIVGLGWVFDQRIIVPNSLFKVGLDLVFGNVESLLQLDHESLQWVD